MAEEVVHPFLPEQEYEELSTYDFIYFIQDYSPFLRKYIDYLYDPNNHDDPEEADVNGYFKSFIEICEGINTDHRDDGTFEAYRPTLEPLIEFMTQSCEEMNVYYKDNLQKLAVPNGIAYRTRSKGPASVFEIPPNKKGMDTFTLEPIKQEGVRIKLSDGKEYTYPEIKNMWNWNKTITPRRHPYTEEDIQKINDLINFTTKGGKKTRKNKKKSKSKKVRKSKQNKKTRNKRSKRKVKLHGR
jgi:hypothetical protein